MITTKQSTECPSTALRTGRQSADQCKRCTNDRKSRPHHHSVSSVAFVCDVTTGVGQVSDWRFSTHTPAGHIFSFCWIEMTLRPNNNRTVEKELSSQVTYGYWWGEDVGLDSTEGKDPKRTRMRTMRGFHWSYILLQAVLHEASACTLGQVK